ncbi:MAG: bacteriohemerythrin [Leptospirales bacterium]|nr:bacteriohemerythrin [Leptospirales bacterium]
MSNYEHEHEHKHDIVTWSEAYATGIKLIDDQHRGLVDLTNKLYLACLNKEDETVFKETMSSMVEYVRFHFSAELQLLERVNYPDLLEHKKQHESLVKSILDAAKDYGDRKKFVPNTFVRTLKDWVFGHIAHSDRLYVIYIADQKKKGLLSNV